MIDLVKDAAMNADLAVRDLALDPSPRLDHSRGRSARNGMKLLLIDTCGAQGSIALADISLDLPLVAQSRMPGRQASERLVAVVREAMAEAGWRLRELAAIAVVNGPGSFTGVRVGLSAAKGLGEAAGVPLIAISRLAVLAGAAGLNDTRVCSLLDAGRGEFYCGQCSEGEPLGEALLAREDTIAAALQAEVVVACEESVAKAISPEVRLRLVQEPGAADALPLAQNRLAAGSFDDPLTLDANYLRRTDAEIFAKPVAPLAE